jgi:hypothetical protein
MTLEALRVPAGMLRIGELLLPRRYGLVRVKNLTCIHGHKIRTRGRTWEVALPCTEKLRPDYRQECGAVVLVYGFRPALPESIVWMMDVSIEEEQEIDREGLDLVQVLERFQVEVPRIPYVDRHQLPPPAQQQNRRGR